MHNNIEPKIGQRVMFTGDCQFGEIIDVFNVAPNGRNNHFSYALDPGINIKILWDEKLTSGEDFITCHLYIKDNFIICETEKEELFLQLKYSECKC